MEAIPNVPLHQEWDICRRSQPAALRAARGAKVGHSRTSAGCTWRVSHRQHALVDRTDRLFPSRRAPIAAGMGGHRETCHDRLRRVDAGCARSRRGPRAGHRQVARHSTRRSPERDGRSRRRSHWRRLRRRVVEPGGAGIRRDVQRATDPRSTAAGLGRPPLRSLFRCRRVSRSRRSRRQRHESVVWLGLRV